MMPSTITCVPYQAEGNPTKAVTALKDQVKAIVSRPFIQHLGPISSYPLSFRSEQIQIHLENARRVDINYFLISISWRY